MAFSIRAAAADWVARRDAGLSVREELDYTAWLDAAPAHRTAADGLHFAWKTLDRPLATGAADAVLGQLALRARLRRRRRTVALGVASLVLLVGADAFAGLTTWHRWRDILGLAHLGISHRPGFPIEPASLPGVRKSNPAVTVKPGLFNNWFFRIDGYNTPAKVRRIK